MAELTATAARKLLGLPARKAITDEELQQAWRTAAKSAYPDAGGSDAAMAEINAARDLLEAQLGAGSGRTAREVADYIDELARERGIDLNAPDPKTTRKRRSKPATLTLSITPEGALWGPGDVLLGRCGSVAHAVAYCGKAGWDYALGKELSAAQRMVLEASHD